MDGLQGLVELASKYPRSVAVERAASLPRKLMSIRMNDDPTLPQYARFLTDDLSSDPEDLGATGAR